MRVHPSLLNSSGAKWHFPVAVVLLLGVIVSNLVKGSDSTADASQSQMVVAIVVVEALQPDQEITKEMLKREYRPLTTLPADYVTDWEQIKGKVPVGLVPSGYPLAKALLKEPMSEEDLKKLQQQQNQAAGSVPQKEDPFVKKLEELEKTTVAITLPFVGPPPTRGSRIALSLKSSQNKSVLVGDDVWVEQGMGSSARLRVSPKSALFLEESKSLGVFSYFVLGAEGDSPFKDQVVSEIVQLKEKLGLIKEQPKKKLRKKKKRVVMRRRRPDSFRSYAWVTGEGTKYSVGDDGRVFVITEEGFVQPLFSHYFSKQDSGLSGKDSGFGSWFQGEGSEEDHYFEEVENEEEETSMIENPLSSYLPSISAPKKTVASEQRRVETGLEPFYPLVGMRSR